MNFFGKRKPKTPPSGGGGGASTASNTDPASALQALKTRIKALEARTGFLEKKAHAALVEAKRQSQNKNKRGAMQALKRKKMYEAQVDKLHSAVTNLEQQAFAIENASTNVEIVTGMNIGHKAAAELQKKINIEKVENLKDDIQEQMQMAQEVDDILGAPMGDDLDDDDLLAELDELDGELDELDGLEEEVGEVSLSEPEPKMELPAAPVGKVNVKPSAVEEDDDAKALAALEAEMMA